MNQDPAPAPWRGLRLLAGIAAVVVGLAVVVLVSAVGHCSAFGGRCPAQPPPLLEDDVFGSAFFGGLLAVGLPLWLARPGWRRVARALAIGLPVAFFVGLLARSAAAG